MSISLGKRGAELPLENPKKRCTSSNEASKTKCIFETFHTPSQLKFISNPTYPIGPENLLFEEAYEIAQQAQLNFLSTDSLAENHPNATPELQTAANSPESPPIELKELLEKKSICDLVVFIHKHQELATKHKEFIFENLEGDFLGGAIYRAISISREAVAIFLLDSGSDPNWRNKRGKKQSLLQVAVYVKNTKIVETLLDAGASVDLHQNKNGDTILHLTKKHIRSKELYAKLLEKAGEKATEILKIKNNEGRTPEDISKQNHIDDKNNFIEILKSRDKKKLKIFVRGKDADFLSKKAHRAMQKTWHEAVPVIIEAGANMDWKTKKTERTLLGITTARGNLILTQLMLRHRAKMRTQDINGDTPLHHAFRSGQPGIYKLLCDHARSQLSSLLKIKNKKGLTPEEVEQKVRKSQSKYL